MAYSFAGARLSGPWRVRQGVRTWLTVLCATAAGGALAAPPPAVPVYREFRDWIVACDNTRRCEARLAPEEGDALDVRFAMSRFAGPAGAVQIELDDEKPLPAKALQLDGTVLDAADQPDPGGAWKSDGEGGNRLEGEPARRLGRALSQGRVLVVGAMQGPVKLSLDGLAAALLFIDDVQGRVGNMTAWREPGNAVAALVPAEPPAPELRSAAVPPPLADADAFAARVRSRQATLLAQRCDPQRGGAPAVDQAMPLSAAEALVLLQCWAGPYQTAALVLRVSRNASDDARPVVLPVVPGGAPRARDADPAVLTEAFYDPDTGLLTSYAKGRGIGDCGYALGWLFDGRAFRAASRDEQRRCAGSPGDWPTLYRSRVLPPGSAAASAPGAAGVAVPGISSSSSQR